MTVKIIIRTARYCSMRTREILEKKNCSLLKTFRTASGIVPFESSAIGFSSSIVSQNAINHENQTITSDITLFFSDRNYMRTVCHFSIFVLRNRPRPTHPDP